MSAPRVGRVESIQISIQSRVPMRHVEWVWALSGAGLQGCRHSRKANRRAVLLMDVETLDELGLEPGQIKENITSRDLDLSELRAGAQIQLGGQVVLEVDGPCVPCRRMNEIRPGLMEQLRQRRGLNCVVLQGGRLAVGDPIRVLNHGRSLP